VKRQRVGDNVGSSSSSMSFDPSEEGKDVSGTAFYEARLKALAAEEAEIQSGENATLRQGEKELREMRDRMLRDAEIVREMRIREAEELFEFDKRAAEDTFRAKQEDLRAKLLGEIQESIKRLEDLRDGNDPEMRVTARKLRSKRGEPDEDGLGQGERDPPGGYGNDSLGINFFMTEKAVAKDMAFIQRDWKKRAENFLAKNKVLHESVKIEDGALYYNEHIFEKENDVVCYNEVTKEQRTGKIQTVNPQEVVVRFQEGRPMRVLLSHLRSGRCSIAPAPAI